jgi:hypothetical protein
MQPANGSLRDAFLAALDGGDRPRVLALAHFLTQCPNALPSATCLEFDLPAGSTYGAACRLLTGVHGAALK